jgi:hypothetical protein
MTVQRLLAVALLVLTACAIPAREVMVRARMLPRFSVCVAETHGWQITFGAKREAHSPRYCTIGFILSPATKRTPPGGYRALFETGWW